MFKSKILFYVITTILLIIISVITSLSENNTSFLEDRGNSFIKNLANEINDIDQITISGRDLNMVLIRDKNNFVDPSGYPFKKGVWESFITSITLLRIEEKKTNVPDRHNELNLISVDNFDFKKDQNDPATKIILFKDDAIYSSFLLGKVDNTVGGLSGGQFARYANDNQSYLLKGALRMPTNKSDWFDSLLFTTQKENLNSIELIREKKIFEIDNISNSLSLKNNVGLSIDSEKLDQIAEIIQSFYFYDVRKNSSKIKDVSPKLTFKLNDGLSINIQLVNFKNKEEAWVKIYANSTNMKSKLKSEEINKRTKTYDFLANINTSEVFNWKIRDLIKAK